MKTRLLVVVLLAATSLAARPHVFVGAGAVSYVLGSPPPVAYIAPPVVPMLTYIAPIPGRGYVWVAGYWYPAGSQWYWHSGYWARLPYPGAYWVPPRYHAGRFYFGYWRR
jgi:WXXGXW repeat (2 copies)